MIETIKLATLNAKLPAGHQLLGWIDKHPSGKGGSYAVLTVAATGIEVAWDGTASRSLPKDWRKKVEFEGACNPDPSVRKNITQPADWWRAFDDAAVAAGVSLSEWIGDAGKAKLADDVSERLSARAGAHRPKKDEQ